MCILNTCRWINSSSVRQFHEHYRSHSTTSQQDTWRAGVKQPSSTQAILLWMVSSARSNFQRKWAALLSIYVRIYCYIGILVLLVNVHFKNYSSGVYSAMVRMLVFIRKERNCIFLVETTRLIYHMIPVLQRPFVAHIYCCSPTRFVKKQLWNQGPRRQKQSCPILNGCCHDYWSHT